MKKKPVDLTSLEILYKTQELLEIAPNRYKLTVQVAARAKRKGYEDADILSDFKLKPVIRAIIEMSEEVSSFYSRHSGT